MTQILKGAPNIVAISQVIASLAPDILVLSGVDYDLHDATLIALQGQIETAGLKLPHTFAPRPNTGFPSGLDLNNDGQAQSPDDAHGYGDYAGARSLAVLSRYPLNTSAMRDFSQFLWADMPGALLYSGMTEAQRAQHRLSSVAHVELPVVLPQSRELRLLIYQAGPPVFGNHPDRNRKRNHDETAFWSAFLDGTLSLPPPTAPFVLIGGSNLDPFDGDGINSGMRNLLAHPALQDPRPASLGAAIEADPKHAGPAQLDTVDWDGPQGNLRVAYILPSHDLPIRGAGVLWPAEQDQMSRLLSETGTAHRPVWVDLSLN